ncbi:MAG: hypothetical protein R2771_11140 [Saprospiraceae bacterium]
MGFTLSLRIKLYFKDTNLKAIHNCLSAFAEPPVKLYFKDTNLKAIHNYEKECGFMLMKLYFKDTNLKAIHNLFMLVFSGKTIFQRYKFESNSQRYHCIRIIT